MSPTRRLQIRHDDWRFDTTIANSETRTGNTCCNATGTMQQGHRRNESATTGQVVATSGYMVKAATKTQGRPGRKAMPLVRKARATLADMQRRVAVLEKQAHAAAQELAVTVGRTARQRQQAAFKNASRLLESARRSELEAGKALAEAISSEVAASTIRVQERAVAVYKDALNRKRTAALKKGAGWICGCLAP